MQSNGKFITFEGIDGAGKTTIISKLSAWLSSQKIMHVLRIFSLTFEQKCVIFLLSKRHRSILCLFA